MYLCTWLTDYSIKRGDGQRYSNESPNLPLPSGSPIGAELAEVLEIEKRLFSGKPLWYCSVLNKLQAKALYLWN